MPLAKNNLKTRQRAFDRVWRGVRWGIAVALCYVGWAAIVYLTTGGEAFTEKNASFLGVVGAYLAGGIGGGAIVGALVPVMRRKAGAVVVGIIGFAPVLLAFRVAQFGFAPWTSDDTLMVLTLSLLLGGFGGLVVREVLN